MYDYPRFDGSQACHNPTAAAARAFGGAAGADPAPALALCNSCGFTEQCLGYALRNDVYGVWGGTTEPEREQLRTERHLPSPTSITAQLDQLVDRLRMGSEPVRTTVAEVRRAS